MINLNEVKKKKAIVEEKEHIRVYMLPVLKKELDQFCLDYELNRTKLVANLIDEFLKQQTVK